MYDQMCDFWSKRNGSDVNRLNRKCVCQLFSCSSVPWGYVWCSLQDNQYQKWVWSSDIKFPILLKSISSTSCTVQPRKGFGANFPCLCCGITWSVSCLKIAMFSQLHCIESCGCCSSLFESCGFLKYWVVSLSAQNRFIFISLRQVQQQQKPYFIRFLKISSDHKISQNPLLTC